MCFIGKFAQCTLSFLRTSQIYLLSITISFWILTWGRVSTYPRSGFYDRKKYFYANSVSYFEFWHGKEFLRILAADFTIEKKNFVSILYLSNGLHNRPDLPLFSPYFRNGFYNGPEFLSNLFTLVTDFTKIFFLFFP